MTNRPGRRLAQCSTGLIVGLLVALIAAPAAQARKAHSLRGVVLHLRSSDRALGRMLAHPAGPLAGMYLARVSSQTVLAGEIAQAILARAHGGASTELAATALGLLADHQTSEAQSLTSVLSDVRPDLQSALARAISTATGGRGVVLGALRGLLGDLPRRAQPIVAQVLAMESSQGAQVPVELAGVLGGPAILCTATGAVQQALVIATQAFALGLANLGPALALVPVPIRAQVQSEIDGVPTLLRRIEGQLAGAVPCAASPPASGLGAPAPVTALKPPALLAGMTQLIDGILGRVLPGLAAGQPAPPQAVAAPAPLSGLLAGVGALVGGTLGGGPHG